MDYGGSPPGDIRSKPAGVSGMMVGRHYVRNRFAGYIGLNPVDVRQTTCFVKRSLDHDDAFILLDPQGMVRAAGKVINAGGQFGRTHLGLDAIAGETVSGEHLEILLVGRAPLGQRTRLRTVVDSSAEGFGTVLCSGGRRGLEIELAPADLVTLTGASVAPIASQPRE